MPKSCPRGPTGRSRTSPPGELSSRVPLPGQNEGRSGTWGDNPGSSAWAGGVAEADRVQRMGAGTGIVEADDPRVSGILTEMVAVVVGHGGAVHPGARLLERGHDLTVECEADAAPPETPLFRVPRELLVPVTGATWSDSRDALVLLEAPQGLSPAQEALLTLFIDLYNACEKVPRTAASHPATADLAPGLIEAVRMIYPRFRGEPRSAAEVLIGCRVFGLTGPPGAEPAKTQVLMPLIDLLDHNEHGAPYAVDATAMTVQAAQPLGDHTCYARYGGRRDPLGQALHYGYVDTGTTSALSAAVDLDVAPLGRVVVDRSAGPRRHRLDPPKVTRDDDGTLRISHAFFDRLHPQRLTGVLELVARGAVAQSGAEGEATRDAGAALRYALAQANLDLLEGIQREADPAAGPAAATIAAAARAQAAIFAPWSD